MRELVTLTRDTRGSAFARRTASAGPRCALATLFPDCPAFDAVGELDVFESFTRARLQLDGRWSPRWSGRIVYDHEFRLGVLDRLGDTLAAPPDTFLGAEAEIHAFGLGRHRDHRRWRHALYRGYLRYEGDHIELTVGRQRIPWGVGRLWNPIDRFNAIPPLAVEGDQSPGIDAVETRWLFSGFSYLQGVYAPATRSRDARYAIRWQGVLRDVDVSVMAGVFEQARTLGGDLSGNLGEGAWRLEAVWTDPERRVWPVGDPKPSELGRFWQIVLSFDLNIDLGTGIYFLIEHLYDGNALGFGEGRAGTLLPLFASSDQAPAGGKGSTGPYVEPVGPERFGGSGVISLARQTTGLQLGYDLTASLRGDLLLLHDWNGASDALFATLSFTGWNTAELRAGVQVFRGPRLSAFGDQEPLFFVLAEWFF